MVYKFQFGKKSRVSRLSGIHHFLRKFTIKVVPSSRTGRQHKEQEGTRLQLVLLPKVRWSDGGMMCCYCVYDRILC